MSNETPPDLAPRSGDVIASRSGASRTGVHLGLSRCRMAVSIVPGELRLLVARTNGAAQPVHQLGAELPEGAVRVGLRAPNLADPSMISDALRSLAEEAKTDRERVGLVALLIPDAAVRLALVPLEGAEPRRAEGDAMARWALRDLLPVEPSAARIDWAVVAGQDEPEAKWLLAVGAEAEVVREYESVVERLGWVAGRVVPLTMGLAVGAAGASVDEDAGAGRIVLSAVGEQLACLVESGGVPRMHRAWRGMEPDLDLELPNIERYVGQRLGLSIAEAVLAGPEAWRQRAAPACEALGWRVREISRWSAHLGAIQP